MSFITNWFRGANNASDNNVVTSNAKDENQVKKGKISPVHAFYRELFEAAESGPNVSKDLEKFRLECTKNNNALYRAHKNGNKKGIRNNKELLDKSVGALIDESMKCGAKENIIKVIEKYDGKLSEALNEKIEDILLDNEVDKILLEDTIGDEILESTQTENVSQNSISSEEKSTPTVYKRRKTGLFNKPKETDKKPAQPVYKKKVAGSFRKSKENAHNNENVDNSAVAENENLNVLTEENKVKEVDAKAKEICEESTSLFKKCVSAGGNLLLWGAKAPFKGVGCVANGLWMGGCKVFKALNYSLEHVKAFVDKLEATEKLLNRPIIKRAVYTILDSFIEKNVKSDMSMAGEKAAVDTIKDIINKGEENIDLVVSHIGSKIGSKASGISSTVGGLVGSGVGLVTGGMLGNSVSGGIIGKQIGSAIGYGVTFVLGRLASNFLSRSEKAVDSMDKRWHNAILKKYCADQKTPMGKGALSLFCMLNSIGYFDDIDANGKITGKKNDAGKK